TGDVQTSATTNFAEAHHHSAARTDEGIGRMRPASQTKLTTMKPPIDAWTRRSISTPLSPLRPQPVHGFLQFLQFLVRYVVRFGEVGRKRRDRTAERPFDEAADGVLEQRLGRGLRAVAVDALVEPPHEQALPAEPLHHREDRRPRKPPCLTARLGRLPPSLSGEASGPQTSCLHVSSQAVSVTPRVVNTDSAAGRGRGTFGCRLRGT